MQRIRARLSFANVISLIALFAALGGTSYAALKLPKNSVGAKQIKAGAVRSSEVKNGSLLAKDFKAGQLPAGAQGPAGAAGAQGVQGPQGPAGIAAAYARVQADGTLETLTTNGVSQFKGVAAANVQHAAAGIYCFGGLGFDIASALVAADNATLSGLTDRIASVAIARGGIALGTCDADHQQARVEVIDASAAALTDSRFTIWFEQ